MHITCQELHLASSEKTDFIDITEQISGLVRESGMADGICTIFTKHTTTAVRINENEKGLLRDIACFLENNAPQSGCYEHDNMEKRPDVPVDEQVNGHSHLKSLLLGSSESIPFESGRLCLGKWQAVLFIDLDGPRKRKVLVQIIGNEANP